MASCSGLRRELGTAGLHTSNVATRLAARMSTMQPRFRCYQVIDLDQDVAATELRLSAVDPGGGGQVRQKAHAHSSCLRERVHPSIDLGWEF